MHQSEGEVKDTIVSLGKQISKRWYVGYERGLNATAGSWQLTYRIAQRLLLRFAARPSGGAFSANGTAATGGGSSSYLTAGTTLLINSRRYTDSGSGIASSTLTIQSASLAGNSCSSFGTPSTISGTTSQTVASGNCYLLTLTGTDNVGIRARSARR